LVAATLAWAAGEGILAPGGRLIIEHSPRERPLPPPGLILLDTRAYGQSELSFLAPEGAEAKEDA
jgi:hypothetical protein